MPEVIGGILKIRGCLTHGMLVEAIEAGLIDDIEDGFLGIGDGQRGVAGSCLAVCLDADHRTEMDTLLSVTCGVTCHRQLRGDSLHLMGHLGRKGDAAVNVATQTDGDEFIRVRGKILTFDGLSVAYIPILDNSRVEAQRTMIVADGSEAQVFDMQRTQRLEILRVRALHIVLQ